MPATSQVRMARRASNRNPFVSSALAFSLMCSAASAAFEGTSLDTVLQLAAILIPFAAGIALAGWHFVAAPVWRRSPVSGLLTFLFFGSAIVSSCLAAIKYFDPYPLWFCAGIVLALVVWGGIWAIEEDYVWSAFRLYCILSTLAIVAICLVTRHPGERFQALLHPSLWGLLCFANFCLAGLIANPAIRIPVQLSNILVIMDAQSRSAMLATLVAGAVLCFFAVRAARVRSEEKLLGVIAATGTFAGVTLVVGEWPPTYFAAAFRIDDPYRGSGSGFTGRTGFWQSGLRMIEANPLFGVGPRMEGNYISGGIQYSHSGYISMFAQYGVIGATLFFAMTLILGRGLWLMAARQRPGAAVGVAIVIGYAAEAIFEPKLLSIGNPASLLMLAFLLLPSVRQTPKSRPQTAPQAATRIGTLQAARG